MNPQTDRTESTPNGIITYSLTPFEGCTTFRYKRIRLIDNEVKIDAIYGVTDSQGRQLIERWNLVAPGFWFYELVEVEKEVETFK